MEFSHPFIRFFLVNSFSDSTSPFSCWKENDSARNLSTRFSDSSKIRCFTFKWK